MKQKRTKDQIRTLDIEIRAAELSVDAPRTLDPKDRIYSPAEFRGWAMHYFHDDLNYQNSARDPGRRTPINRNEWAGWLAREIYVQGNK